MTISDYFNPDSKGHVEAYAYFNQHGYWPNWYLPHEDVIDEESISTTVIKICNKMAKRWMEEKLK